MSNSRRSEASWKSGIGAQWTLDDDDELDKQSESLSFTDESLPSEVVPQLIMLRFNLAQWHTYDEEERNKRLEDIDALELLDTLRSVEGKLATLRLENYILKDFLKKNDEKLLMGYKKTRETRPDIFEAFASSASVSIKPSGHSFKGRSFMERLNKSRSTVHSVLGHSTTRLSSMRRVYEVNFETKREIAEKLCIEVEKRTKLAQKKGKCEIKDIRVKIEELNLRNQENVETRKNFVMHFKSISGSGHYIPTEHQYYLKLRRFMDNWMTNANTMISKMRLDIEKMNIRCNELNVEIITKSEWRRMLTGADFEQLHIRRTELLHELAQKKQHVAELKQNFGNATVNLVGQKTALLNDEKAMKQAAQRFEVLQHLTDGLIREIDTLKEENEKGAKRISELKMKLQKIKAPSVADYIQKKENISRLEKEIKVLKRKINILKIH